MLNRCAVIVMVVTALVVVLAGCGGGSSGPTWTHTDTRLVGTWNAVDNGVLPTVNGVKATIPVAFNNDAGYTAVSIKFNNDGTATTTSSGEGMTDQVAQRTWQSDGNTVVMTKPDKTTDTFTFVVVAGANPAQITTTIPMTNQGVTKTVVALFQKQVTDQPTSIAGTWHLASATQDGVVVDLNVATNSHPGTTSTTITYGSDGNFLVTDWGAGNTVLGQVSGTWSASGNTITWHQTQPSADTMPTMTYSVSGNSVTLRFTQADESNVSHAYVLTATKVAAGTGHDPNMVGIWQMVSATANGAPLSLAVLNHWGAGVTRATNMFAADGGMLYIEYPVTVGQGFSGTWTATGGTLTMKHGAETNTGSYTGSGSTATLHFTDATMGAVVVTLNKIG